MRPELDRLQFIESQVLAGTASAADWQHQLLLDPDLAADAQLQQRLYQGLRVAGREQLRRELLAIHVRLYGRPEGWWQPLLRRLAGSLRDWLGGR